ncbi:hypothetical protein [Pedobacter sp. WC2423]|uniref:hypothetical protein n=1 Tax=Pedobacter sp. WC2423 TaxID=3234142 RepID=UPI0034679425
MDHYKILPDNLTAKKINALADEFDLNFQTYLIAIVFPKYEICLLSTLQYRFDPTSPWIVKASNLSSNNHEITFELGSFSPELPLQLFWIVNGITKLSSVAIFLGNKETKKFIRIAPAEGSKVIEKGKDWIDEKKDISLNF